MKCKQCNVEISNRAKFCSDKCRMQFKRSQPEQKANKLNPNTEPEQIVGRASYEHYLAYPELFAKRSFPDKLNWGVWMNYKDLKKVHLVANRVPLPGDFDYVGVC